MNTETPTDKLVSLKLSAAQLGISLRGLYRLIAAGTLPRPVHVGGSRKFFQSDLNTYLEGIKAVRSNPRT